MVTMVWRLETARVVGERRRSWSSRRTMAES